MPLTIAFFNQTEGFVQSLEDFEHHVTVYEGGSARSGFSVDADGGINDYSIGIAEGFFPEQDWITPALSVGNFVTRVTVILGTLDTGTIDTWLAPGSANFAVTASSIDTIGFCTGTLEIARATDTGTILASCTFELNATSSPGGEP